jgi:ABC-2 type transport system permease protein
MREILILLKPRLWSFKNRIVSRTGKRRTFRIILFGTIGPAFWAGIFWIFYRLLTYFKSFEGFGDILAYKLLSMALITFFSLLLFSGILTSLSKLYLSKDLDLVHAMPVSRSKIFLARWMESTLDSSWMVLVYSLPIFLSYGLVYQKGVVYYAILGINLLPFCMIASSLSVLLVIVAAAYLPAGRIRSVFLLLGFLVFLVLIISFRMMRPERFANPESFTALMFYLQTLESSHSPLFPSTWFFDSLKGALSGRMETVFLSSALSWTGAITFIFLTTWAAGALYFRGLSRAQTVPSRFLRSLGTTRPRVGLLPKVIPGPMRALAIKEIKTFFRDQTQWSQIFLIIALIIIYLYNFSVLPLEKSRMKVEYVQNLISFLNMGLAAFVLSAVSARFVFPAVSMEGDAFWILKSSPVSIRTVLWAKFAVYLLPLLLLSEILVIVTNLLLHVTPFMMVTSVVSTLFVVPGIVSMGIGLGAIYPDFHSENPAQSVTSFGGVIYMTLSLAFVAAVVAVEAGPVYDVFMTGMRKNPITHMQIVGLSASFAMVLVLCLLALILPMRLGEQWISQYEFGRLESGSHRRNVRRRRKGAVLHRS